jgi:hypothetical protein
MKNNLIDFEQIAKRAHNFGNSIDTSLISEEILNDNFLNYIAISAFDEFGLTVDEEGVLTMMKSLNMDMKREPKIDRELLLALAPLLSLDNRIAIINHLNLSTYYLKEAKRKTAEVVSKTKETKAQKTKKANKFYVAFILFMFFYGVFYFVKNVILLILNLIG